MFDNVELSLVEAPVAPTEREVDATEFAVTADPGGAVI